MSSADWSQSPARGPGAAARMAPVKGEWGNSEEGFWEREATGHVYLGHVGAPEGPRSQKRVGSCTERPWGVASPAGGNRISLVTSCVGASLFSSREICEKPLFFEQQSLRVWHPP